MARQRQAALPDLPPFAGGAVGYFGYDLVRTVEPLGPPNPDPIGLPDMALMLSDVLVVFDHLKHTISVLVNVDAEQPLVGEQEETLRAFLTYVPIDSKSRIPALECLGDDERAAFDEVEHRLALQRSLVEAAASAG